MKTFFVTLAAFSLALVIGCQENMLNEPSETITEAESNLITHKYYKAKLTMYEILYTVSVSSYRKSDLYISNGHQHAMNTTGLNEISIHLNMDSELENLLVMMPLKWSIQGRSDDIVYVSEDGIVLIEKCYWITNRNDVVLLVQYLVTTNGVGISGVSLAPLEK
ncbi:MAG: hypothetical protein U5J96_04115 [Ignavibacteriaceae bacterium]|nr:hypothetical protein [Ignavibacteriaceae bacterium]